MENKNAGDKGNNRKRWAARRGWNGILFLLPSLAGVLIFVLIPYIDVVRRAMTQAVTGKLVGLDNFVAVLKNEAFLLAVLNTIRLIIVCLPVLILLSLIIAVFLKNGIPGKWYFQQGLLLPMAVPVAAVVLIWQVLFAEHGFLSGFLHIWGMPGMDWMNTKYAFVILAISYVWKNLGYSIILWMVGLGSVPDEIYEAAHVDGAGDWCCFFKITIPNILPSFFMIAVLSLINIFKVFREAYLVAGDYPNQSIYLTQHLFNNWFRDMALDKLSAGAVINGVVMFGLIFIFWRLWSKK
jgi:multiple sugar transport system permease protein